MKHRVMVLLVVGLLPACGASALTRGADFYMQKRYIDAAQVFEHVEPQLPDYAPEERARYALYRGATLLALGDVERGAYWLEYGSGIAVEALSRSERREIARSLASSGGPTANPAWHAMHLAAWVRRLASGAAAAWHPLSWVGQASSPRPPVPSR